MNHKKDVRAKLLGNQVDQDKQFIASSLNRSQNEESDDNWKKQNENKINSMAEENMDLDQKQFEHGEQISYNLIYEEGSCKNEDGIQMPAKEMLDKINYILKQKELDKRKDPRKYLDISKNLKFGTEEAVDEEIDSMFDLLQKLPKESFDSQDLTEFIQDFDVDDQNIQNLYFKKQIEQYLLKNYGKEQKNLTKSELVEIRQTQERYLILYYIEEKVTDECRGYITQCHIFKYYDKFELIHKFLADVKTESEHPKNFNRVFINAQGVYYLQKMNTIDNEKQILVKHIQFDNKTGFGELKENIFQKENNHQMENLKQAKEVNNLNLDDAIDMGDLEIGFFKNIDEVNDISDQFVFCYQQKNDKEQELIIYSLNDTSKPVIKYSNPDIKCITQAFVIINNDGPIYFIIKYQKDSGEYHLEIKWERNDTLILDRHSSVQLVFENYEKEQLSLKFDQQVTIERLQVSSDTENIDQLYFISAEGSVQLIYPYQEDEERRQKIRKYIRQHHSLEEHTQKELILFLNKQGNKYQYLNEQVKKFLESIEQEHQVKKTQILFIDSMIIYMDENRKLSVVHLKQGKTRNYNVNQYKKILKANQCFLAHQIQQLHSLNQAPQYLNGY